jgi:M3 family oligoendopeptidase
MYEEMSKDTGEFINYMLEHELFDVIAKKGKSGGGYCTELVEYKMPFIFANFNGTYGDIDVLTHEAGHALASYKAMNNIPLYELNQGGMETCEVHSMSMEFFAWKWMDLFFKEKAEDYRFMHISNAVYFIPYGTMVDYFQQCVYEKPEMTPAERKALWLKLEATFRPYMGQEGITYMEEGGRWQYQSHIYERPFYYIDYCLAQTIALDFLVAMRDNYNDAWKRYNAFLSKGGSETFVKLVEETGFKQPFDSGALSQLVKNVDKVVASIK